LQSILFHRALGIVKPVEEHIKSLDIYYVNSQYCNEKKKTIRFTQIRISYIQARISDKDVERQVGEQVKAFATFIAEPENERRGIVSWLFDFTTICFGNNCNFGFLFFFFKI
jgi:hypothetical protein